MSESTAVEAPAAKEPFFKMSSIPGANILVPLLLGCLLNTLFPDLFKTLGSFTLGMTQQGAGPLVGAFLLIVGTTSSFKSAPAAAARGAIIIAVKQIVVVAVSLLILYAFNDNLFGISAMVMLAACTGANNAMYAGLMGTMGNEAERGAVAITTLVVGPPVTMIVLGAAGQAPIGWSLVGAILPIVVGISYEFNRLVGRHDNWLTRALSAPGMWLQYLTTNEPDDSMLEVGIEALTLVLPEKEGEDRW